MVREGRLWLLLLALAIPPAYVWGALVRMDAQSPRRRGPEPEPEAADAAPAAREGVFPPVVADGELDRILASAKSLDRDEAALGRKRLRSVPLATRRWWAAIERRKPVEPEIEETLTLLDDLRRRARRLEERDALVPTVFDPELSERARRHAAFLTLNHDLGWPDMHDEDPKRPGASPEGAAAGQHAVISFCKSTIRRGIDSWMATYFHRLPLLEGAVAVGWGSQEGIQVLDATTLSNGRRAATELRWPAEDAHDVPVRFSPWGEVPDPAPGLIDQFLGYPITLQVSVGVALGGVRGELRVRRRGCWEVVPCLLSSPQQPLQSRCVPFNAVCLLPRGPLDPDAEHEVTFTLARGTCRWTFRTMDAVRDVEGLLALLRDPVESNRYRARAQLRALDSRWAPALPALNLPPGLTVEDYAFTVEVEERIRGARDRVRGRTMSDWESVCRQDSPWEREGAYEAAVEYLAAVRERTSDPSALASVSPDAATAMRLLRSALASRKEVTRMAAVEGLRASGTRHAEFESELAALLSDDSPYVRRAALAALGDLDRLAWDTASECRRCLTDDDEDVRFEAALLLNREPQRWEGVRKVLLRATESWRSERRLEAARELARWRHDPAVSEALVVLTRDRTEAVRHQARLALEGKTQE